MRQILLVLVLLMFAGCQKAPEEFKGVHDIEVEEALFPELYFEIDPTTDLASGNDLEYVNLHCTADTGGSKRTREYYLKLWGKKGWRFPGYNYLVYESGVIDTLLPVDCDCLVELGEVSNGVYGVNSRSINIAYVGGVKSVRGRLVAYDTRTEAQIVSLHTLVSDIQGNCPDAKVFGHRDHPRVGKACPSFRAIDEFECWDIK